MPAQLRAPPREKDRNDYRDLFRLLMDNPGEWGSLPLTDVTGETPSKKQSAILSSGKNHGLHLQTSIQADRIYARVRRMDSSPAMGAPEAEPCAAASTIVPRTSTRKHKYREFFSAIAANPGEWASVPVEEVGGKTRDAKLVTIISCARAFDMRVTTSVQDGRLYARLVSGSK